VAPAASRPRLDPEDEALLRSDGGKSGKGQPTRTFANKVQGDFTWLLRTQYISEDQARYPLAATNHPKTTLTPTRSSTRLTADRCVWRAAWEQVPKHMGIGEKKMKEMRNAEAADAPLSYEDAAIAQVAAIEASFEAASRPPVHATKPHLTPVEVMPVFPDENRWPTRLTQVRTPEDTALNTPASSLLGSAPGAVAMRSGLPPPPPLKRARQSPARSPRG
jgi:hypothetical protein